MGKTETIKGQGNKRGEERRGGQERQTSSVEKGKRGTAGESAPHANERLALQGRVDTSVG